MRRRAAALVVLAAASCARGAPSGRAPTAPPSCVPPERRAVRIDVRDFGAVGRPLRARGRLADVDGGVALTIEEGDAEGWARGGGVGLVVPLPDGSHAGAGGRVVAVEREGGRARLRLALRDRPAAFARGALVEVRSDDAPPIQEALDAAPARREVAGAEVAVVRLPAGTYVLGAPFARGNAPLLVRSRTHVEGDGPARTHLVLADEIDQHLPVRGPVARAHAAFMNEAAVALHPDWGHRTPPRSDEDVGFTGFSLDGNRDHQCVYWTSGGDATLWTASGAAPASLESNGRTVSFRPGDRWVRVTLVAADGRESTPSDPILVRPSLLEGGVLRPRLRHGPDEQWAPRLRMAVYQVTATATFYQQQEPFYERHDPEPIARTPDGGTAPLAVALAPGDDAAHRRLWHPAPPADARGCVAPGASPSPPGLGARLPSYGAAWAVGIAVHNGAHLFARDVTIERFPSGALWVTANIAWGGDVDGFCGEDLVLRESGWYALGITGGGRDLTFRRVRVEDNAGGCDVEPGRHVPPAPPLRIERLAFEDCRFADNAQSGIQLAVPPGGVYSDVRIARTVFLRNGLTHLGLVGGPMPGVQPPLTERVTVEDSHFDGSLHAAITVATPVRDGVIRRCTFAGAGGTPSSPPRYSDYALLDAILDLNGAGPGKAGAGDCRLLSSSFTIEGNRFEMVPRKQFGGPNQNPAIRVASCAGQSLVVKDNFFDGARPERAMFVRVRGDAPRLDYRFSGNTSAPHEPSQRDWEVYFEARHEAREFGTPAPAR